MPHMTLVVIIGGTLFIGTIFLTLRGRETPEPYPPAPSLSIATTSDAGSATTFAEVVQTVQETADTVREVASTTIREIVEEVQEGPGAATSPWKRATATVFWVGEGASGENGFIHNASSAWDVDWEEHFGGLDDPDDRCGYLPCAFTPQENPFYIALPYNDLDDYGNTKSNARQVPWFFPSEESIIKNRWIEVRANGKSCFGQWEDVGPFSEDDFAYVFGAAVNSANTIGEGAGIDLSPAMRDCLGVDGSSLVEWRHVETEAAPPGPWKEILTTRLSQ